MTASYRTLGAVEGLQVALQKGLRSDDFDVLVPAGSDTGAPSRPRHPEVFLRASRDREVSAIQGPDHLDRFASDRRPGG